MDTSENGEGAPQRAPTRGPAWAAVPPTQAHSIATKGLTSSSAGPDSTAGTQARTVPVAISGSDTEAGPDATVSADTRKRTRPVGSSLEAQKCSKSAWGLASAGKKEENRRDRVKRTCEPGISGRLRRDRSSGSSTDGLNSDEDMEDSQALSKSQGTSYAPRDRAVPTGLSGFNVMALQTQRERGERGSGSRDIGIRPDVDVSRIHANPYLYLDDFDEMEAFQDDGEDYLREAMEEAAKYRKCSREMMLAAKGRPPLPLPKVMTDTGLVDFDIAASSIAAKLKYTT